MVEDRYGASSQGVTADNNQGLTLVTKVMPPLSDGLYVGRERFLLGITTTD